MASLTRRHKRLRSQYESLQAERDKLLNERDTLQERVRTLEQKLSVAAVSLHGDVAGVAALDQLERDLDELIGAVEKCILLLDTQLGDDTRG